jgi:hypothetical protein
VAVTAALTPLTADHRPATSARASGSLGLAASASGRHLHGQVHAGGQLVEQRHLGGADEGQRDRKVLLLAAGQLAEEGVAPVGQAEPGEQTHSR